MDITNWSFRRANDVVTNEKLECMNRTAEALFAREHDVKTRIEVEERDHRKRTKKEVGNWLMEVDELKDKKRRLEMDAKEGQFGGKKLKEQVEQLNMNMAELLKQGDFPNGVTLDDLSLLSLPLVTTQLKGEQFEKNLRTVLSWCDDGVSIIGVWGVGGIGKTTLVTHIHNALYQKLKSCGNSGNVYWVTVSHGITTSNLQGKIAKAMHLDCLLNVEDQRQRAAMLSVALKKKENSVLILDDVWEKFPLENVGIPVGVNGCKLILTTRSFKVCRVMECQETIWVECLSEEESWELFKDKLGSIKNLPLEAMDVAKLIAKECAGLPLAIKVVATSMRGIVDICEWRNALGELKKPTRQHEDMDKEVLELLQLSYDRLNDAQLQNCFLHYALYYEDYVFNKYALVESWIRDGLIENMENRQKQFDKGCTMINRLLEACLLEAVHHFGVKMHDVVRDMAVKVARESRHFMIRAGEQLQDLPCEEEWTDDLSKISLMGNEMKFIQPSNLPRCPNLQTFFLQSNQRLLQISYSFFWHMKGLMYLDFSGCHRIKRLPDSVSYLENLRALVLRHCVELEYIPSLAKLRKLKELNLYNCPKLVIAPEGMEELVKLRYLNIRFSELVLSWSCLCSKLPNLEDLRLEPSMDNMMTEDLMKLQKLERLNGWWIHDIEDFNRYIKSLHHYQLNQCDIFVGLNYGRICLYGKSMVIERCGLDGEVPVFPGDLQKLEMTSCDFGAVRSLEDVVQSLHGLTKLKVLVIVDCKKLKDDLANLKPQMMRGVQLSSLRKLRIYGCDDIKQMFGSSQQLPNLDHIEIVDCPALEEIFGGPYADSEVINLSRLTHLKLKNLPRLRSVCGGGSLMPCDSIEEIGVERCSKGVESIQLMSPRTLESLENLKALATGLFRPSNLCELTIFKCHQIKQIFPPNQLLPNLLLLEIEDCYTLQEIFAGPHSDSYCGDENTKVLNLPKLSCLKLEHLPKLRSICGGCLFLSCDSIEEIHIVRCRNLTTLPLLLPSAQPSLKRIFAGKGWWESLQWEWEGNNSPSKHALELFLEFHDEELGHVGRIRMVFWAQEAPHGLKRLLWRILYEDLNNFGGTCGLCQRSPETPEHLLLFCDVSRDIWFRILGISVEPLEDLHSFDWLDALLYPPNWMLGRKGATSADVLLFVLALADKLYTARNEVIHGNVNLDLSSLIETIQVSFNCLKRGILHAKSQRGKIPSTKRIYINFDASIMSSYSIGAVVVSTCSDPCIHMEIMRIDTTDTEVAQENAAWMAATISLRWPDNDLVIYGNNKNIINAVTRVHAPCCQSTSEIISYIHDLFPIPSKGRIRWVTFPVTQSAAHALATWAAAVNCSDCAMDIMDWNFMPGTYLVPNEVLDEVRERTTAALVAIDGNVVWFRALRLMRKDVELLSKPLEEMEFGEKS